ncbi:MAG: hypothetical protein ABI193_07365 [Minicystis sp.]
MNQRFYLFAAIVSALTALPAVASAQTQTWLSDRKYTEGIGIRVGDFELHPGAAAEFGYDSNYYRRAPEENPIGALRFRLTPSFSISTLTKARRDSAPSTTQPDFEFRAAISATYNEFFPISGGRDETDRAQMSNDRNVSADLDLRLGIMPGRTWSGSIYAGVVRALTPSNNGLNADPNGSNNSIHEVDGFRRILPRAGGEIAYTPGSGLLDWRLGYQFSGTFFESANFNQLSNIQNQIETRGRWRFLPRTALIYDARFGFITYPNPTGKTASHPMRAMLGVSGLVTNTFSVQAMIGWGASFYTPKPQEDFNSVIGRAEAKWFLAPGPSESASASLSTISVGFSRDFFDSFIGTYLERDRGYIDFSYFFGGRFLLVFNGGAGPIVYPKIDALKLAAFADIRIDASLFGEYRFKDTFGVNANVRYNQNISGTSISINSGDPDYFKWNEIEAYLGFRWFM